MDTYNDEQRGYEGKSIPKQAVAAAWSTVAMKTTPIATPTAHSEQWLTSYAQQMTATTVVSVLAPQAPTATATPGSATSPQTAARSGKIPTHVHSTNAY